ncbi:LOW QUALITY PROTEIN: hypothetical protein MXB_4645, partial [Myxobolus squamalis]
RILTESLVCISFFYYKISNQECLRKFAIQFINAIKESSDDLDCTNISDKHMPMIDLSIPPQNNISIYSQHGGLDITVHESFRMGTYLPALHEHAFDLMNSLEYNDDKKDTCFHIHSFKKFILLIKIINCSMPDILSMWENDEDQIRNEISVDDMAHLLKAIFQNTKHRADTISSIKSIQNQIKF